MAHRQKNPAWELLQELAKKDRLTDFSSGHDSPTVLIPWPEVGEDLWSFTETLRARGTTRFHFVHGFRPAVLSLAAHGFPCTDLNVRSVDEIFFVPTRQRVESLAIVAHALTNLSARGHFTFACANDQGAAGFVTQFKKLIPDLVVDSGNKCKWFRVFNTAVTNRDLLREWILEGDRAPTLNNAFVTQPGIYGWNKVDRGSELLVEHILAEGAIHGTGADLGCGYGYLSQRLLQKFQPDTWHLIEADRRALECAQVNLQASANVRAHWLDVTAAECAEAVSGLDFVVMNPPFHEGSQANPTLGLAFIQRAAQLLKSGGELFMVANAFLPYEDAVQKKFKTMKKVLVRDGFKVIQAKK